VGISNKLVVWRNYKKRMVLLFESKEWTAQRAKTMVRPATRVSEEVEGRLQ
jgi:hypothetical protein